MAFKIDMGPSHPEPATWSLPLTWEYSGSYAGFHLRPRSMGVKGRGGKRDVRPSFNPFRHV
jgi:hypothetical protein